MEKKDEKVIDWLTYSTNRIVQAVNSNTNNKQLKEMIYDTLTITFNEGIRYDSDECCSPMTFTCGG